jgi:hypothetical protein
MHRGGPFSRPPLATASIPPMMTPEGIGMANFLTIVGGGLAFLALSAIVATRLLDRRDRAYYSRLGEEDDGDNA